MERKRASRRWIVGHRNFFPSEGLLLRECAVPSVQEQLLGVTVHQEQFHRARPHLTLDAYAGTIDYKLMMRARSLVSATFERVQHAFVQSS
jgi:hypothetical protein